MAQLKHAQRQTVRNSELSVETRLNNLLNRLTLDEKFKLLAGTRFFRTHSIKRLGIKPFKMTDGPLGVSMHSTFGRKNTRFPGGICLAASFNRQLANEFGVAVGKEVRATGRSAILAPGININRSPLNGRTFEYFSEDPYLTKEIAIPYVQGVQSQRIAACVKHYVANNQETNRFTVSAEIDPRTLHEIYLRAFMEVIKESDPWLLMTSYNKVNGQYLFANKTLLRDLLWDKWGFNGFIISDWWSFSRSEPPVSTEDCIKAGMSLEMPKANKFHPKLLQSAYSDGKFSEDDLNAVVKRLLRVMILVGLFDDKKNLPPGKRNTPDHQNLARKMAEEGMVLLKNRKNILPLNIKEVSTLAVLGPNREKKFGKWLYGGSSAVKPPYEITPLKGLKSRGVQIISDPSKADFVIIFAGLNHDSTKSLARDSRDEKVATGNDSEGIDRIQLELPQYQVNLINQTVQENPNTIVVLLNGSPVAMDGWLENVPAVIEAWYPGMEGGHAIANVLFGDINPSGKLPLTFPKKISDSPAHKSIQTFPGVDLKVKYAEGIYVGYRHFDKANIEPLFPFGFGLSYSSFKYDNLQLSTNKISTNENLIVSVDITNTGNFSGSEVVQAYFHNECSVDRPVKELVGFEKVFLTPDESKTVDLKLKPNNLTFYDPQEQTWRIEPGMFNLFIGNSSHNVLLEDKFEYI
ncbi:MAG: glycoside hydrolase family 3 C-terminal domain-containing protein [Candidatus Heimdallarchaeota archaeon]|nr:MAG: glycoside hydrolase family 3 C-terminal domain-containing protein [Candidatus Heimdallarchaeota archaeon]